MGVAQKRRMDTHEVLYLPRKTQVDISKVPRLPRKNETRKKRHVESIAQATQTPFRHASKTTFGDTSRGHYKGSRNQSDNYDTSKGHVRDSLPTVRAQPGQGKYRPERQHRPHPDAKPPLARSKTRKSEQERKKCMRSHYNAENAAEQKRSAQKQKCSGHFFTSIPSN